MNDTPNATSPVSPAPISWGDKLADAVESLATTPRLDGLTHNERHAAQGASLALELIDSATERGFDYIDPIHSACAFLLAFIGHHANGDRDTAGDILELALAINQGRGEDTARDTFRDLRHAANATDPYAFASVVNDPATYT